jgi:hypothetical protein
VIYNFVLETSNAPGTAATINLAGAPAGRLSFATSVTNGSTVFYFMDDGAQAEAGIGTFNTGAPNTLTRGTVLWNSSVQRSTPARLNFTGTVRVYCDVPAENTPYFDAAGVLTTGNRTIDAGTAKIKAAAGSTGTELLNWSNFTYTVNSNGWSIKFPNGMIVQTGAVASTGFPNVAVTFPTTFPTAMSWGLATMFGNITSNNGASTYGYATTGMAVALESAAGFNWIAWGN